MRTTNANGKTEVWMPPNIDKAMSDLTGIHSFVSAKEWQRAALVALIVRKGKGGRPRKDASQRELDKTHYTVEDFMRKGIYGLESNQTINVYLKAWSYSGQPVPEYGDRIELPDSNTWPKAFDRANAYVYGREAKPDPEPEGELDEDGPEPSEEDTEEAPAPGDRTQKQRKAGKRPSPAQPDALDKFLKILDRMDPATMIAGKDRAEVDLLIKTLESWLTDLREVASENPDE